mmetsp:Transcript_6391/g.12345  ORF Transcript_6391/g.12345 Transcript_6391/m.12345 type:complete len:227 (-) Transcript_6391:112-792(-)
MPSSTLASEVKSIEDLSLFRSWYTLFKSSNGISFTISSIDRFPVSCLAAMSLMRIDCSKGHPRNAVASIDSTDFGISTVASDVQDPNILSPMDCIDDGITIEVSFEQTRKASSPISVTESGITTLVKDLHPINARSPMDLTDAGIAIEVSFEQPSKAYLPISVTEEDGIAIEVSFEQPKKASQAILVTEGSTITLSTSLGTSGPSPTQFFFLFFREAVLGRNEPPL